MERQIYSGKDKLYQREVEKLNAAHNVNKELIKEFHRNLFSKQCGEVRVAKLSAQLRKVSLWLGKRLDATSHEDVENSWYSLTLKKHGLMKPRRIIGDY